MQFNNLSDYYLYIIKCLCQYDAKVQTVHVSVHHFLCFIAYLQLFDYCCF